MRTLWLAIALSGVAGTALADVKETVVVVGTTESCGDATPERARWLADEATREQDYQRAGECYLAAGQRSQADEAFVKASAQSKAETGKRLAANLNDLKASARQMKQALQRR